MAFLNSNAENYLTSVKLFLVSALKSVKQNKTKQNKTVKLSLPTISQTKTL